MGKENQTPEAAAGNNEMSAAIPRFGSKRDVAAMLQMSVRSVDNYVANGCPCIALSKRRLRFDMQEVRRWFIERYGVQKRHAAPKTETVLRRTISGEAPSAKSSEVA